MCSHVSAIALEFLLSRFCVHFSVFHFSSAVLRQSELQAKRDLHLRHFQPVLFLRMHRAASDIKMHFLLQCLALLVLIPSTYAIPSLAAFLTGEDYVGLPATLNHADFSIEAWVFVTEDNRDASGRVRSSSIVVISLHSTVVYNAGSTFVCAERCNCFVSLWCTAPVYSMPAQLLVCNVHSQRASFVVFPERHI